jgi:hypothetical protein
VFGPIKGRSGYPFADVHDDKVLDRVNEFIPHCVWQVNCPKSKLLGKEFVKGICGRGGEENIA